MFDRFTDRAKKVMSFARQEAQKFNHEYIGTEHILLGLVKEGQRRRRQRAQEPRASTCARSASRSKSSCRAARTMVTMGKLPQTPRAKKVIEYSMEEARNLNHNYVGTEHMLLGLLREQEGVAAQVLMNLGLKLEDVREEVLNLLGHGRRRANAAVAARVKPRARGRRRRHSSQVGASKSKTPGAGQLRPRPHRTGARRKLDPVIGPELKEIERVIQVLPPDQEQPRAPRRGGRGQDGHRRGPRPACHPAGNVPEILAGQADRRPRPGDDGRRHEVPRAVRGADQGGHERGASRQERDPVHRRAAHAGRRRRRGGRHRREQRAQARPQSRGEIQCIGATTLDEYRKYIEKDNGAGPRFQEDHRRAAQPRGDDRDPQGPARPLRGAPPRAKITDDAVEAAVELSERYITARVPARQGDRRHRRGGRARPAQVDDQAPGPERIDDSRGRAAQQGEGRGRRQGQDFERAADLRDKAEKLRRRRSRSQKEWREKVSERSTASSTRRSSPSRQQDDRHPADPARPGRGRAPARRWRNELHKTSSTRTEAIKAVPRAVRRTRSGLKDPNAADGLLHVPRPVGRRQDAAQPSALAKFMFGDRGRADPDRHVGVHGEAQRRPASSARLRATSATRRVAT